MKNLTFLLGGVLAALTTAACNCKPPGPTGLVPDFVPKPTALSFDACPSLDENGLPVDGAVAQTKELTITNQGRVGSPLALSISGAGAAAFVLGANLPTAIDRLETVKIPISFAPTRSGGVTADLTIDDKTDATPNPVVTLEGKGSELPAQPTIETAPQKQDSSGFLKCVPDAPLSECIIDFPDTLMNQSATLQLKIRNRGCPPLKITSLEIAGRTPGSNEGFTIDSPAVLPSAVSPLVLSTADGTEERTITLRFTASDDGSGATFQSHYAVLIIKSNDPNTGDGERQPARLSIQANAIKPSIYVSPTSCNFTNSQDRCGNVARIAHKANFRVTNDGNTPVRISAVRFRSSGGTTSSDSRFSVTANIQGQTLAINSSASIEVTEMDQPLLVSDQLEIVADIPQMGAGSGGTVVVSVISGRKPCLITEPDDAIDFGDPMEELTARTFRIKNGTGPSADCGTLTVNSVAVSTQPFFSLIDPLIPPNTMLPVGGSLEATVQYRRPSSGGMQLGELKVVTNDTDYGPPQHKLVLLRSNASLDSIPNAQLTACSPTQIVADPNCAAGSQTSVSYNLSMIDPDEITLSGVNSTDNSMVREYRFILFPIPGVPSTALANHNVKMTSNKTKLTIPPGATGTYRVGLKVWDDRGQESGNTDVIVIDVYQ